MKIELTGWNNGGWIAGKCQFGLRVRKKDRELFRSNAKYITVILDLPNSHGEISRVEVWLSPSFWRGCPKLEHEKIREWMLERGDIRPSGRPWPERQPPKYKTELIGNHLRVIR